MIIKKTAKDYYSIIPESPYDLINLKLFLLKKDLVFFEKQLLKKNEFQTKKDAKIKLVKIQITNITNCEFTSLDSLIVVGQYKNRVIKKRVYLNKQFYILKKLKLHEKRFLTSLAIDKQYYFAVDVDCILIGYSINYEFITLYKKQYSFKKTDLKKQIQNYLEKFKPIFKNSNVVYKTLDSWVNMFNKWFNLDWKPLVRSIELDWQTLNKKKQSQQSFIRYCLNKRKNIVNNVKDLLIALEEGNISEIFVNAKIDIPLYNILTTNASAKIKVVPFTESTNYIMPEGFLLLNYF